MAKVTKFYVLPDGDRPGHGVGVGHHDPRNTPWAKRPDGTWVRGEHTVEKSFPGTKLPWTIAWRGKLQGRAHGKFAGYRRFKTAAAAMMSFTLDATVFASSPWHTGSKP